MLRSPVLLAALADAAVPGIRPVKVEGLAVPAGAVYQSAHVTGHDARVWVVRSALTGAAGAELAASDALVQLLARRVPFDLPRVEGSARPKEGPAVAVYAMPRGKALEWADLQGRSDAARAVGVALAHLHDVDPRVVEEAGLPSYDADTYRQRLLADLDRAAGTKRVPSSLLSRWEQALETKELWRFSTCVTHGPLRGEDVLVDEGEVSAVTGWEHAGVADPARDFSLLWTHAPRQAFDTAFEAYAAERSDRPDGQLERRIRLMGEMELAYALLASRTMGEDQLVDHHAAALESLAFEVEDDTSLLPPTRRSSVAPIDVEAPLNPADIESVGQGDLAPDDDLTVEIPVTTSTADDTPSKAAGGATRVDGDAPKTRLPHRDADGVSADDAEEPSKTGEPSGDEAGEDTQSSPTP